MASLPLPQTLVLPPLGITLNDQGQMQLNWLPQQGQTVAAGLAPEVRQQIAVAVLAGESATVLHARLPGIESALLHTAMAEYAAHPLVEAARAQQDALRQRLKKLESHARIDADLIRQTPGRGEIDRREHLDAQTFFRDYYAAGRPVVLTGMMRDWPALQRWTPAYFEQQFGDTEVEVQFGRDSDPDYEVNRDALRRKLRFGEFVRMVEEGGPGNDYYLVAGNEVIERSALSGLMADVPLFPGILEAYRARNSVFFWYGPAGTVTPLHHDPCNIVLTQIRGRKKLKLYSPMQTPLLYNELGVFSRVDAERPDLEAYPHFAGAAAMETELAPGEALFIPVGWWHHVRSLDVAVSVSATCFAAPNSYGWEMPSFGARRIPPRAN